uniref:Rab5-interacting protein n=1 Tax=Tetranychus urticae TaxID=32264 RepID=T1KTP9_TETUR
MFTPNSSWEDKDQFLDVIYWSRQVLAIFMGMIWGFIGITGFFGIASFVALNSIAVYLYSVRFNNDTEDIMEFVKEGFMTSFAGFLVIFSFPSMAIDKSILLLDFQTFSIIAMMSSKRAKRF